MKNYNILLVEDSPVSALITKKLLHSLGHSVVAVSPTGEDSLVQVERARPDITLMDINLAGELNGIEAAKLIVERFDVPVIMVTGESDEGVLGAVAESLATGFISKPINLEELKVGLSIAGYKHELDKKLRASETKFRNIFNNSAAGIYLSDLSDRYLDCNETFARMLGYDTPLKLKFGVKSIAEQVYSQPDRRELLLEMLREQRTVMDFESEVYGRDGDAFWISEHCKGEFGPDGELTRFEAVVVDITARIEAEQAYRSTLELLQRTIDTVPQVIFLLDLECNLILYNDAFKKIFAPDGQELIGTSCASLVCVSCSAQGDCFLKTLPNGDRKRVKRFGLDLHGSFYNMTVAPFFDPKGEVIGAVHTLVEA